MFAPPKEPYSVLANKTPRSHQDLENVATAGCLVGAHTAARGAVDELRKSFPDSSRVALLEALLLQATLKHDEAVLAYDELLQDNPANAVAAKRRASAVRVRGHKAYVKELLKLLDSNQSDLEVWGELARTYEDAGKYAEAKFAREELVVGAPFNLENLISLGECLYTLHDYDLALKYFLKAETMGDSLRAALNVVWTTCRLMEKDVKSKNDDETLQKINRLAVARALELTEGAKNASNDALKSALA